jgi:cytochrome c peroxidase
MFASIGKAIAAYERKIVSRDAPFDAFVRALEERPEGPWPELSLSAQRGLGLFVGKADCFRCHHGAAFSDGEFHDIRVAPLGGGAASDPGRHHGIRLLQQDPFGMNGAFSDAPDSRAGDKVRYLRNAPDNWGAFRTPGLRNVALTAPYMHQGQLATLRDVLHYYSTLEGALPPGHHPEARLLVPLDLTESEIGDLVAFLESLSDAALDPAMQGPPPLPSVR